MATFALLIFTLKPMFCFHCNILEHNKIVTNILEQMSLKQKTFEQMTLGTFVISLNLFFISEVVMATKSLPQLGNNATMLFTIVINAVIL
jgi:hypothetical protein